MILKQRRPRYTTRDWYLFLAADKQKEINYVVEAVRKGGSENSLYRTLQSAMPYLEHGVQLDLKGALEVLKERGRA